MSYENLRSAFDELACEIFSNCYTMQAPDRIARVQKLHDLGLQTLEAAKSRDDAVNIRVAISTILHRGYSISSAAEQGTLLRNRFGRVQSRKTSPF